MLADLWCRVVHGLILHAWGEDLWGVGDHLRCWRCGRMWQKLGWYR